MNTSPATAAACAKETFGHAELGDERRTRSLVAFAAGLMRRPAGRVTEVFKSAAKRERAYRLLENGAVTVVEVIVAMARAVAVRIAGLSMVYAVVDGSSLTLADRRGRKDFGRVGAHRDGARGLKVITAFAVERTGIPLGVLWQCYWARQVRERRGTKRRDNLRRATREKETQRWLDAINGAAQYADAKKLWYLLDREGDSRELLQAVDALKARFTIRSSWNRLLVAGRNGARKYLRGVMNRAPLVAEYVVNVPAAHNRLARRARMRVRSSAVRLLLKNRWCHTQSELALNVVWAREVGTTPRGEKRLDWMLLTNAPASTGSEALDVVRSYQVRWRIEDFHRTWKSGRCNVEDTQLHSMRAATIFAAMNAAAAARIERLKHLSRNSPNQPASLELTLAERTAIAALAYEIVNEPVAPGGRRQSKLVVPDPETMDIATAVQWIAMFGGYTGKSSGGPPGATVIGRGLEEIVVGARVISVLLAQQRKRR